MCACTLKKVLNQSMGWLSHRHTGNLCFLPKKGKAGPHLSPTLVLINHTLAHFPSVYFQDSRWVLLLLLRCVCVYVCQRSRKGEKVTNAVVGPKGKTQQEEKKTYKEQRCLRGLEKITDQRTSELCQRIHLLGVCVFVCFVRVCLCEWRGWGF